MVNVLEYLPRGNMLSDKEWAKRHRFLQWVLLAHPVGMFLLAVPLGRGVTTSALVLSPAVGCALLSYLVTGRRPASFFVTAGLVYCSAALVWVTSGSIESHFHFFVIIGFIALYQDWVPFLWNITFTVLSHGLGSWLQRDMMFNHPAAQNSPWLWSAIHGVAVLAACTGMVIFWRVSEDEQNAREALSRQLSEAEIGRRRFTSELLVNLARRNQTMLYRQLDIINHLEEKEQDPDALAELFRLDHLATRVRRNAESLLVLSGEEPYRVWSAPVPLHDVVRAAIAETEHLDRVEMSVDRGLAIVGHVVTDLTHLLAELTENAVRFSPPDANVDLRTRRHLKADGAQLITIEDYGVGMPPSAVEAANLLFTAPPEVDLSVSRQLGFHVVGRLAARHGIAVSLSPTPGSGITAAVLIPAVLFADASDVPEEQPQLTGRVVERVTVGASARPAIPAAPPAAAPVAAPPAALVAAAPPLISMAARVPSGAVSVEGGAAGSWPGWWDAPAPKHRLTTEPRTAAAPQLPAAPLSTPPFLTPPLSAPPSLTAPPLSAPPSAGPFSAPQLSTPPLSAAPLAAPPLEPSLQLTGPQLSRRVPQTHLAPELRSPPREQDARPTHVSPQAPEALSRYQASRRAARAAESNGNGEHASWSADQR